MENRRNYYRILQVQPDAPFEVIRGAYRTLLKELRLHPDLGGDHWNAQTLTEAYETLSDPARRAAYDRELTQKYSRRLGEDGDSPKVPLSSLVCPDCGRVLGRADQPGEGCASCSGHSRGSESTETTPAHEPDQPQEAADRPDEAVPSRRSLWRQSFASQVAYELDDGERGWGRLLDLSIEGARFRVPRAITPGIRVSISSQEVEAVAEVAHCSPAGEDTPGEYEIGVRFLEVRFNRPQGTFVSRTI